MDGVAAYVWQDNDYAYTGEQSGYYYPPFAGDIGMLGHFCLNVELIPPEPKKKIPESSTTRPPRRPETPCEVINGVGEPEARLQTSYRNAKSTA